MKIVKNTMETRRQRRIATSTTNNSSSTQTTLKPKPHSRDRGLSDITNTQTISFLSPNTKSALLAPPISRSEEELMEKKRLRTDAMEVVKRGKHSEVSFGVGVLSPNTRTFAIKKQLLHQPQDFAERAYRELLIFKTLSSLRDRTQYYPKPEFCNFIRLRDWWKILDHDSEHQRLHMVLEKADMALADLVTAKVPLTLYELRCILFQSLFALYVAQTEFEFVHNDLHLANILLKTSKYTVASFKCDDTTWYTSGYLVKLSDFGLSRIRLNENVVIYDPKQPLRAIFTETADVEQLSREISKVAIDEERLTVDELRSIGVRFAARYVEEGYVRIANLSATGQKKARAYIEQVKASYSELKRKMRKQKSPLHLLHDEFFYCLQTPPTYVEQLRLNLQSELSDNMEN